MFWHNTGKKIALICLLLISSFGTFSLMASDWGKRDELPPGPVLSGPLEQILYESSQFTQMDDLTPVANYLTIPSTFDMVGETSALQLYAEPSNGAIRIVNRTDGFTYGSSFDEAGVDIDNFNMTWEGIINSAAVIKYYSYNEANGVYTILEESMYTDANTVMEYSLIENGFQVAILYGKSGIGLTIRVFLEGSYLHVEVPSESITEGDTYKIRSVKFFPFLGSVFGDTIPGYVFVPDGSGALIRYKPIDEVTDIYEFPYYGTDPGINPLWNNNGMLNFPVYGMIEGIDQHGFVSIIENGAPFAALTVSPAKNNLKYYYAFNEFIYRSIYTAPTSKASASLGSGLQVIETDRNSCDISVVYKFLSGTNANYVGMANSYQDYLREHEILSDISETVTKTPALIELIGAETKTGFLWNQLETLTSFADADAILTDLSTVIPSMSIVYKGWSQGGYSAGGADYSTYEPVLGTKAELDALLEKFNSGTNSLSLYADYLKVYEDGKFNYYQDLSQRIDTSILGFEGMTKALYYLSPERAKTIFLKSSSSLLDKGYQKLALGTIGYVLYSDYKNRTSPLDRGETMTLFQEMFAGTNSKYAIYRANDYLLAYMDQYLLVPMVSSNFNIYTDTVPFVAILLSGTMETFGPYANFFANQREEWLKSIDYGIAPSFILTKESAYLLQDTEMQNIYSSSYSTWKNSVTDGYSFVANALDSVYGQRIASRNVLQKGVVKTVYENGTAIFINYTNDEVVVQTHTVPAQGYEVVEP